MQAALPQPENELVLNNPDLALHFMSVIKQHQLNANDDCFGKEFDLSETPCRVCHAQASCAAIKSKSFLEDLEPVGYLDEDNTDTLDLKCLNFISNRGGEVPYEDLLEFIETNKNSKLLDVDEFILTLFDENDLTLTDDETVQL